MTYPRTVLLRTTVRDSERILLAVYERLVTFKSYRSSRMYRDRAIDKAKAMWPGQWKYIQCTIEQPPEY